MSRTVETGKLPGNYVPISLDLDDVESIDGRMAEVVAKFPELDAVISNAGGPAFGNLEQISASQIRWYLRLNLTSHILVVRALLPFLKMS